MDIDADTRRPSQLSGDVRAESDSRTRFGILAAYHSLIKSRQTLLLYATGICAYILSLDNRANGWTVLWFSVALLFSIGGCTALNMVIDRDIDAKMSRTQGRPLVTGTLSLREAILFGTALSIIGLGLAFWLSWRAGLVIATGFIFDLGVYSLWLKRRTALSIIFGGISGGMPALAGRTLALGQIDLVGILFALSILLWIPSHIVTLTIKYREDYRAAGVPVWPNVYGELPARRFIAIANLLNAGVLVACGLLLEISLPALALLAASALAMVALAVLGLVRPTERLTWVLFKAASIYMLLSFLLITFGVIL